MSNPFKDQLSKSAQEEQKRKEEERKKREETTIKLLSFFQKGKDLTEEEKKEFLEIDEKTISDSLMYHMIYYAVKRYIETGKVTNAEELYEEYRKKYIGEEEVLLEQIPEKWRKNPKEAQKESNEDKGEKGNAR